MKSPLLALLLVPFLAAAVRAEANPGDYRPESRSVNETFTSKVVRVYAFEDDGPYAAYVVTWKEHEVVVQGRPGARRYEVGEDVRCSMSLLVRLAEGGEQRSYSFSLAGSVAEAGPGNAERLEKIAEEVRRRRELRSQERPSALPGLSDEEAKKVADKMIEAAAASKDKR